MVKYITQALKQTSREATILLYALVVDTHLQKIAELADRVGFISIEGNRGKIVACTLSRIDFRQMLQGHHNFCNLPGLAKWIIELSL